MELQEKSCANGCSLLSRVNLNLYAYVKSAIEENAKNMLSSHIYKHWQTGAKEDIYRQSWRWEKQTIWELWERINDLLILLSSPLPHSYMDKQLKDQEWTYPKPEKKEKVVQLDKIKETTNRTIARQGRKLLQMIHNTRTEDRFKGV